MLDSPRVSRQPGDATNRLGRRGMALLGEGLEALKGARKPDELLNDEDIEPPEPEREPKTQRSSFYTLCFDLPSGVPRPPAFRSHAQHVIKIREYLKEVEESPEILEIRVSRARRQWKRMFQPPTRTSNGQKG